MINLICDEYQYVISCSKKAGSTTVRTIYMALHIQEILKKLLNDEETKQKIKQDKLLPYSDYISEGTLLLPTKFQHCSAISPAFSQIMLHKYDHYKKIMIINDPYKRFVSGFIHLVLIKRKGIPCEEIEAKYGISFKGFIAYMSQIFDNIKNEVAQTIEQQTFRVISHFFDQISGDRLSYIKEQYHVIRLESLNVELPKIYSKVIGINIPNEFITEYNNTVYSDAYDDLELDIPNMHFDDFTKYVEKFSGFPKYHHFYCSELKDFVEKYYQVDLYVYKHVDKYQKYDLS